MAQPKIWLVTGAAKGFGREIVKAVLASGDKVIATVCKDPEKATIQRCADLLPGLLPRIVFPISRAVPTGVGQFPGHDNVKTHDNYEKAPAV
jgi:NAD(P)-dependent dehydrogenase (short-subunit alcohol dehydrogenase family)